MNLALIIFLNFLLYISIFSQNNAIKNNNNNIDIDFILETTKENNPNIKIKEMESDINKTEVSKTFKSLILPPVSLSQSKNLDNLKSEDVKFQRLDARIEVFEGGKSYYTYKQAQVNDEIAEKNVFLTTLEYQEKAIEHYFNVLNYRKQIEITSLVINALKNQSKKLSSLFENGQQIALSEIYKIDADIELNNAINIDNKQNEQTNIENLYTLLGIELDSENNFLDFSIDKYLKNKINYKEDEKKLLTDSSIVQKEKLKVQVAEYDVKLAKADLYPTVYAGSKYVIYDDDNDSNEGWMVEVGFKILFAWGGTLDSVNQSKKNLEISKLNFETNLKDLNVKFREQYRMMQSLYGQLLAQKKRLDLLNKNMTLDTLRYDNQLISTFDYLNSINELKKSQEEYYRLQRNLVLTTIKYENLAR